MRRLCAQTGSNAPCGPPVFHGGPRYIDGRPARRPSAEAVLAGEPFASRRVLAGRFVLCSLRLAAHIGRAPLAHSRWHLPEPEGAIIAPRKSPLAVRRQGNGIERDGVALEYLGFFGRIEPKEPQIVSSWTDPGACQCKASVRRDSGPQHLPLMPKHGNLLA